jgi:hypothetical protein
MFLVEVPEETSSGRTGYASTVGVLVSSSLSPYFRIPAFRGRNSN